MLKVLLLQFGSVVLQAFGKLRLMGALVTLAQHEADMVHICRRVKLARSMSACFPECTNVNENQHRSTGQAPRIAAEPFARVFWTFCFLLAWNSTYPALLLVLPDAKWLRGGAALMDAILDSALQLQASRFEASSAPNTEPFSFGIVS